MIIATANPKAADQTRSFSASTMNKPQKPDPMTKRQRQIYEHLKDRIETNGYAPSVREMCEHFQIKSPNGIICHLVALQKKGLIERTSHRSRAIRLVDVDGTSQCSLPLLGTAGAGAAVAAPASCDERVDYGEFFQGENLVIAISGSQFKELGICDRDELIVSRKPTEASDFLIAAVDEESRLILCRHSPSGLHSALDCNQFPRVSHILGAVISVIRRF